MRTQHNVASAASTHWLIKGDDAYWAIKTLFVKKYDKLLITYALCR